MCCSLFVWRLLFVENCCLWFVVFVVVCLVFRAGRCLLLWFDDVPRRLDVVSCLALLLALFADRSLLLVVALVVCRLCFPPPIFCRVSFVACWCERNLCNLLFLFGGCALLVVWWSSFVVCCLLLVRVRCVLCVVCELRPGFVCCCLWLVANCWLMV